MKVCILMGSPRKNGNTAALTSTFSEEMQRLDCECETIWLHDKTIASCTSCRSCQNDWSNFACSIKDDAYNIYNSVMNSDLLVLATPIYSWYCTPPMKALIDRFVYGMNKYYGEEKGPALWEGKKVALISTCGYPPEKGTKLWEKGIKLYCKHSRLTYLGMLAEHNEGYDTVFFTEEKKQRVVEFTKNLFHK